MSGSGFQSDLCTLLLCDILRFDHSANSNIDRFLIDNQAEIDWASLIARASTHGLAPVLYSRHRSTLEEFAIPEADLLTLRQIYLRQFAAAERRRHNINHSLKALSASRIPTIVLKGAYLGEVVYADPALRSMSDVDLLVRRDDLPTVVQVLTDLGYQPARKFSLDFELQLDHTLPRFSKAGAVPIEVHWQLFVPREKYQIDLDGLWQRAEPATIASQPVLALSPEDLLLHLCLHIAVHRFRYGLRAVYDIAAATHHFKDRVDWTGLIERSLSWNANRPTFLLLWLAVELFGAPVPPAVLNKLQPSDFSPNEVQLVRSLIFSLPPDDDAGLVHLAGLVKKTSFFAKLYLVWSQLFLPRLKAGAHLVSAGSWRALLHLPLRWWQLARSGFRPIWSLLRRKSYSDSAATDLLTRQTQEDCLEHWLHLQT